MSQERRKPRLLGAATRTEPKQQPGRSRFPTVLNPSGKALLDQAAKHEFFSDAGQGRDHRQFQNGQLCKERASKRSTTSATSLNGQKASRSLRASSVSIGSAARHPQDSAHQSPVTSSRGFIPIPQPTTIAKTPSPPSVTTPWPSDLGGAGNHSTDIHDGFSGELERRKTDAPSASARPGISIIESRFALGRIQDCLTALVRQRQARVL